MKPDSWARAIWDKAVPAWNTRVQDRTFREFVARPAIADAVAQLAPVRDSVFADIGCGEGLETALAKGILEEYGWTGVMYAYDPQPSLITRARQEYACADIVFSTGRYDEFLASLPRPADLTISQFALQDAPDAESLIENLARTTRGAAIVTLVHPEFGEAMRPKGACRVNAALRGSWAWAAEYPIVEPEGRTFYVPYFQRSVDTYREMFKMHFSNVRIDGFRPSSESIATCERERRSPFCNHPGNVYYPEIVQLDSCLRVIAEKR